MASDVELLVVEVERRLGRGHIQEREVSFALERLNAWLRAPDLLQAMRALDPPVTDVERVLIQMQAEQCREEGKSDMAGALEKIGEYARRIEEARSVRAVGTEVAGESHREVAAPPIMKAEYRCVACGGLAFDVAYPDQPSPVVTCHACGMACSWPLPGEAELAEFYSSEAGYLPSIEDTLRHHERDPSQWMRRTEWILGNFRRQQADLGRRVLDVGCAYGFFLMCCRELGFDAHGVEVSTETSRWAADHGVRMTTGTLESAGYPEGHFDLVTMDNVLEHTPTPEAMLAEARRVLAPGGLLWISVPNWGCLVHRADGARWKWKSWPNHLFYYSPATLPRLLQRLGFEVREVWTDDHQADPDDLRRVLLDACHIRGADYVKADALLDDLRPVVFRHGMGQSLHVIAGNPGRHPS